ncbi:RNA polymerase sigma factor [Fulvivirga sp. M361]|uniref:RNA polymerase sigma factor n=1 Tax=Fulvivirga sp. M361 TaxID=2594266 RepID=UPI001625CF14|nr:sigma-70 family RNA polymerase sigma factor [Fulvivirga sp. M361]
MAVRNRHQEQIGEYSIVSKTENHPLHSSDQEVWKRFVQGDELAFAHIYRLNVNLLVNFGRQFTNDHELVKDVIQDLFIRLRHPNTSQKVVKIKSFLFKCFYRDLIKRMDREKTFDDAFQQDSFAITMSPEHTLINQQLDCLKRHHLSESIEKLSVRQKQALLLFYYEDFSYKEIASILDMKSVKSARKLVYRAISKLRSVINPTFLKVISIILLIYPFGT